jgi:hypothetical protein
MRYDVLRYSLSQVGNRAHCSICRMHSENNQVGRLISGDFENPLRRQSELLSEFDLAFDAAPGLGFRWNQLLQSTVAIDRNRLARETPAQTSAHPADCDHPLA